MFRDDHDAALARIDALEAELKRARSDDADQAARIEKLEGQLELAKRKLADTEGELDQHRPRTKPRSEPSVQPRPRPGVAPVEPLELDRPAPSDRGVALVVAIILIGVVVAGALMIAFGVDGTPKHETTPAGSAQPQAR